MLTFEDCVGVANLDKDEVAEIAAHERLSYMMALEKGASLLTQPWGDAAIRQMVWDNLCKASKQQQADRAEELTALFRSTCERHPDACDRRTAATRPTHPFRRGH